MGRQRRPAKKATASYLERAALHYMERYPATEQRVRRVLERRVRRSVEELETDPEEGAAAVELVITKLRRLGYLDDRRIAASRVRTLRRRGKSIRAIRADLRRLGVDAETARAVMEDLDGDLEAARVLVRRRRLGAEEHRERDLRRLARAGFSYEVARTALSESSS